MENLTNKYIDLHIHTTYSDGTASLPEIIHEARIKQSKMIAITDHDRLLSKEDISLISKVKGNMMVIPGAELSTDYYLDGKKIRLHILCYGLDERATDLNDKLVQFEQAREEGNKIYIHELCKRLDFLDEQEFDAFDYKKYGWLSKRILNYIENLELQDTNLDLLKTALQYVKPIYRKCTFETQDVFYLIREYGGISSWAHPFETKLSPKELEIIANDLKRKGLNGIEVVNAYGTDEQNYISNVLADRYNLLKSCGSDLHVIGLSNSISRGINDNMCITDISMADKLVSKRMTIEKDSAK